METEEELVPLAGIVEELGWPAYKVRLALGKAGRELRRAKATHRSRTTLYPLAETVRLLRGIGDEKARFAYAPGKWTVKEVVGHINDAERIFAYRALRFARGDEQPLTGFDENVYAPAGRFNDRSIGDLLDEFEAIRAATIHLFRNLNDDELARRGTANNNPITVRAIAYVVAGHERHHVKLLHERYGV